MVRLGKPERADDLARGGIEGRAIRPEEVVDGERARARDASEGTAKQPVS